VKQRKLDPDALFREMSRLAARQRQRAEAAGATEYIWSTSGDERVCAICAANDGKRFRYARAPDPGHPGEHRACPAGWCRCVARAIRRP
jgi:uncharacterized protein with gpF-like domain